MFILTDNYIFIFHHLKGLLNLSHKIETRSLLISTSNISQEKNPFYLGIDNKVAIQ